MKPDPAYWNVDEQAAELLQALVHTHQPKEILEVGTSNGYSAIMMGAIASRYGGKITTIEYFEERVKLAHENIHAAGLSQTIQILKGDATDILPSLTKKFDFFFLDANKEEHVLYFGHVMRLANPGAIIVADNTISHRKKLSEFFEAVEREQRAKALELSIGTGLMVITVQ